MYRVFLRTGHYTTYDITYVHLGDRHSESDSKMIKRGVQVCKR